MIVASDSVSSNERRAMRARIWGWARIAFSVALIALLLSRVDFSRVAPPSWRAAAIGVVIAACALTLAQLASAVRWRLLLPEPRPTIGYLTRLYLAGQFFALFLPTSIGGDAMRVVWLARSSGRHGTAVASVALDRVFGVLALAFYLSLGVSIWGTHFVAPIGGWNRGSTPALALGLLALAVVCAGALGLGLRSRVTSTAGAGALRRVLNDVYAVFRRPIAKWIAPLVLALLVQAIYIATWWVLTRALQLPVPASFLLVAVPAVSLAALLPLSISGLGIRDGAWIALLASLGVGAADALTCSLLYFVAFTIVGAAGGLVFAIRGVSADQTVVPGRHADDIVQPVR